MNEATTLRAGVIGWPISHSKSPRLHGEWLRRHGIDGAYEAVAAAPDEFEPVLRRLIADGWRGANVTLPHKEAALAIADESTERARRIGAANTLVFTEEGGVRADNTDGFGFIQNLEQGAGDAWRKTEPALVLGAGGAARAIIWSLLDAGTERIALANRTRARAETLRDAFGPRVSVENWENLNDAMCEAGLIVNTTSLGMDGQPPLEIDLSSAPPHAVVTDIVYTPLRTSLLAQAEALGLATVDGLGMLLHQGRPGFEAWFGVMPEVDEPLRTLMLAP